MRAFFFSMNFAGKSIQGFHSHSFLFLGWKQPLAGMPRQGADERIADALCDLMTGGFYIAQGRLGDACLLRELESCQSGFLAGRMDGATEGIGWHRPAIRRVQAAGPNGSEGCAAGRGF